MTLRPAKSVEAPRIEAFLQEHADTSMFLRANLQAYGPCGGEHRNATRMWIYETEGKMTGVLGLTNAGFVLVQFPGVMPAAEVARVLEQRQVAGIFGESGQVARLRSILGLTNAETQLDEDEPLYSLDLDEIRVPDGASHLSAATIVDRDLLVRWRSEYLVETIHFTPAEAANLADGDVELMLERQSLMLLKTPEGDPVAMTSFNAILPDMVQIGNVYTAPMARGQGNARRAVALHLVKAHDDGAKRAILFASGPAASRAYEAIGFRQVGRFTLLFFAANQTVGAAA